MATTINAYSVSLGLNVAGLVEGGKLARSETAAVVRTLKGLQDPAEKVEQELNLLEKAYREGAIGADVYGEAVSRLNRKLDQQSVSARDAKPSAATELQSQIKGAVAAYASIEGIRAGIGLLQESAERIDNLANTSAQLGESVPNIQSFRYALAQMANIEPEAADQALVRMTRTLGQARSGSKEAAEAFANLGLDINQLAAMSPTQQFQAIADAIAGIEDPTQRAAAAVKLFGKEGTSLLPIFNEGAGAVAGMMAEAEALGLTLSQADAEAIAAMNDEMDKLAAQFQIIIDKILVAMMPAISGVMGVFDEQSGAVDWLIWGIGKMADGFGFLFAIAAEVRDTLYDIGVALYKAAQGDFSFFGKVAEFDQINGFLDRYEEMQRRQAKPIQPPTDVADTEAIAAAEAHTKEYEKQVAELEKQITVMERGEVVARQMELSAQGYSDAEIERLETLREQLDEMKRQEQAAKDLAKEQERIAAEEQKNYENRLKQIENMKIENPEARKAGSAQAVDFLQKLGREETDKQLKAVLEQKALQDKQLAEALKQTKLLEKLNETKPQLAR